MRIKIIDACPDIDGWVFVVVIAVCAFAGISNGMAEPLDRECEIHFFDNTTVPADIRSLMTEHRDSAVRTCRNTVGEVEAYYSITNVWADELNVCQFVETQLDLATSRPIAPSSTNMQMSHSAICPRQDNGGYISAEGVSSGVFVALVRFWNGLGKSKGSFDSAFSTLSSEDRRSPIFQKVQDAFLVGEPHLQLRGIALIPNFPNTPTFGYELQGSSENSRSLALNVDLTEDGFRVFSISLIVE